MRVENRQFLEAWAAIILWAFLLVGAFGGIVYVVGETIDLIARSTTN